MADDPENNLPTRSRPWWAANDPSWKSPWSLGDDEEEAQAKAPQRQPQHPRQAPGQTVEARDSSRKVVVKEQVPDAPSAPSRAPERVAEPAQARMPAATESVTAPPTRQITEAAPVPPREPDDETDAGTDAGTESVAADDDEARRSSSRRRGRRRRRVRVEQQREGTSWASLALMALAVLGLTFVAWLYQADVKEVADEDLRIATPPDPAPTVTSPGRLEVFLTSIRPAPGAGLMAKAPWDWETGVMANWLVENGQALDNLKDLLEDADWHGRHASWHFSDLGGHENWSSAAILKQVEAAYMQRRGEDEAALAAALDMAELARRLQDIHAWPSFYFRSLEIHRRCAETLAELLPRCDAVEDEVLATFQQQFEACAPLDSHVRNNVLPAFYLHEKKLLLGTQSGEPHDTMPGGAQRPRPKQLFFKTNETLGIMATGIRHLVRQVGQASTRPAGLRDAWGGVPGVENVGYYQPNGAGVAYVVERLKPYLDVPARQQLARARHLLVVQLFAVRRFVLREKGLPATLADLSPRYLREPLRDPFTGEPFHYDAAKGLIYSAGSDFVAEGGRPDLPPLADPGEPTVKIGVRTAAGAR